jgi:hypothetical protein
VRPNVELSRPRRRVALAAWCSVAQGTTRPGTPAVEGRLERWVRPECAEFGFYYHECHDATKDAEQAASRVKLMWDGARYATRTEDYNELTARRSTAARSAIVELDVAMHLRSRANCEICATKLCMIAMIRRRRVFRIRMRDDAEELANSHSVN